MVGWTASEAEKLFGLIAITGLGARTPAYLRDARAPALTWHTGRARACRVPTIKTIAPAASCGTIDKGRRMPHSAPAAPLATTLALDAVKWVTVGSHRHAVRPCSMQSLMWRLPAEFTPGDGRAAHFSLALMVAL